jgi:hypothetical protein
LVDPGCDDVLVYGEAAPAEGVESSVLTWLGTFNTSSAGGWSAPSSAALILAAGLVPHLQPRGLLFVLVEE